MPQFTLGDLKTALEAVKDKKKQVFFDETHLQPQSFCGWRGSYDNLCIDYESNFGSCQDQPKEICKKDSYGDHDCDVNWETDEFTCGLKTYNTELKTHTVQELLDMCELITDKVFIGWKGGDFTMRDDTDIWVATSGESGGYKSDGVNYHQVIVGVEEQEDKVVLQTILTRF